MSGPGRAAEHAGDEESFDSTEAPEEVDAAASPWEELNPPATIGMTGAEVDEAGESPVANRDVGGQGQTPGSNAPTARLPSTCGRSSCNKCDVLEEDENVPG